MPYPCNENNSFVFQRGISKKKVQMKIKNNFFIDLMYVDY